MMNYIRFSLAIAVVMVMAMFGIHDAGAQGQKSMQPAEMANQNSGVPNFSGGGRAPSLHSATVDPTADVETEQPQDSERSGQVYGGSVLTRFDGGFGFSRYDEHGHYVESVSASYKMNAKKQFIFMQISDTVVVDVTRGDKPLLGIPPNAKGEARYFFFWIFGYDKNGVAKVLGSMNKDLWLSGDPISLTLNPTQVREFVTFAPPKGVNPDDLRLELIDDKNNIFPVSYDRYAGGFWVYVNPLMPTEYQIIDESTGIIYRVGTIDPLAKDPVSGEELSAVSLLLPGGVQEIPLSDEQNQVLVVAQKLDGHVERPCVPPIVSVSIKRTCMVPAAVYIMDVEQHGLFISAYADRASLVIEARRWVPTGEMPIIAISDVGNSTYVQIGNGYDWVVVTILEAAGEKTSAADVSFEANFYRFTK